MGLFFELADLGNSILYLTEGDFGTAALSGVSVIPLVGDAWAKGTKVGKGLWKAADGVKLRGTLKRYKRQEQLFENSISGSCSIINVQWFMLLAVSILTEQVLPL